MDCTNYSRIQVAVNAVASQWISLQDEVQADYVGAESDVHGVLGQIGSNSRRQVSMTNVWYGKCLNSEGEYVENSSTLAVSVPITLSIKLDFDSVNGPKETYFVVTLRRFRSY